MSRSRKKVPGWTMKTRGMKKFANKRVRRTWDIPDGMAYKKLFCSYEICDWKWLYWNNDEISNDYPGEEYRSWMK
jgi:hypothetical protein